MITKDINEITDEQFSKISNEAIEAADMIFDFMIEKNFDTQTALNAANHLYCRIAAKLGIPRDEFINITLARFELEKDDGCDFVPMQSGVMQ